jgi:hypothetical protein
MWERLVTVMRSQLATDITAVAALDASLVLSAVDDYYLLADEKEADEYRANSKTGVYLYDPSGGAWEIVAETTGMPGNVFTALVRSSVVVEIVALHTPQAARTEYGRTVSGRLLETWRGERYLGAIVQCLKQHAVNYDDILSIDPRRTQVLLTDQLLRARTEWAVEQEVTIPTPNYTV